MPHTTYCSATHAVNARALRCPDLLSRRCRCLSIVRGVTSSSRAILLVLMPLQTSARTFNSAGENTRARIGMVRSVSGSILLAASGSAAALPSLSFWCTLLLWRRAVSWEIDSADAISRLLNPCLSRSATACSRPVNRQASRGDLVAVLSHPSSDDFATAFDTSRSDWLSFRLGRPARSGPPAFSHIRGTAGVDDQLWSVGVASYKTTQLPEDVRILLVLFAIVVLADSLGFERRKNYFLSRRYPNSSAHPFPFFNKETTAVGEAARSVICAGQKLPLALWLNGSNLV
jgi:hypothetical protein